MNRISEIDFEKKGNICSCIPIVTPSVIKGSKKFFSKK